MADKKAYFPFDFSAFFRDTIDLTDKQKMLYLEMLAYQFEHEIGYRDAEHCRKLLGKTYKERPLIEAILCQYFAQKEEIFCQLIADDLPELCQTFAHIVEGLYQKRVIIEIAKRRAKQEQGSVYGKKRWQNNDGLPNTGKVSKGKVSKGKVSKGKEDTNVSSNAQAREKENVSDLNFNDLQVEHGEAISDFWKDYPNGQNKHNGTRAFLRLICAGVDAETIIKGAVCLGEWVKAETKARGKPPLIKHAQNWLEARGWEDALVLPEMPKGLGYTNDKWANSETGYL